MESFVESSAVLLPTNSRCSKNGGFCFISLLRMPLFLCLNVPPPSCATVLFNTTQPFGIEMRRGRLKWYAGRDRVVKTTTFRQRPLKTMTTTHSRNDSKKTEIHLRSWRRKSVTHDWETGSGDTRKHTWR